MSLMSSTLLMNAPRMFATARSDQSAQGSAMPSHLFGAEEWTRIVKGLKMSPRQAQVAALALQDLRDEEIARTLGVSKATIRSHIRQMLQRLGVKSRLGLAVKIFETFRKQNR